MSPFSAAWNWMVGHPVADLLYVGIVTIWIGTIYFTAGRDKR